MCFTCKKIISHLVFFLDHNVYTLGAKINFNSIFLFPDPNVDIRSLDIQVNTVATVLKSFFKDTEPLIPPNLQEELLEAAGRKIYASCF